MRRIFRLFRNTVFLVWLSASLLVTTLSAVAWSVNLTLQVATLTTTAVATAIRHRKDLAKAVTRTKAKGRLRRVVVAVPLAGTAAAAAFEAQDYLQWQEQNPEGTIGDYSCEVANLSAEVIDEVLNELPSYIRPSSGLVLRLLPECKGVE